IEEDASGCGQHQVMQNARDKCDDVAGRVSDRFVLAADTLVCVEQQILGKPKDEEDAARMLRLLSGRWHEVHTGVCLQGPGGFHALRLDTARVQFCELTDEKIARYVKTREPMDKAGAYAIQGFSAVFISRIEGSPSNVMGLPLCLVGQILEDAGFIFRFSTTA
ncbi:MAG: Maf family protein, partial [Clostridia bacterium]|nr:Maf family protein [Clostridia bacterium]